jgi:hypothetical protein
MRRIIFLLLTLFILINAQDNNSDSKLTIQPYGYIKLDIIYDSDLMSIDNFARWVLPQSTDNATPTTHITANESRLGFLINKGDISGKIEFDFYGVGGGENKPGLMVRKAYVQAKLKNFTIRAGQDSDVISPLVPGTINYTVAWWAGDIGYRRPMVKLFNTNNEFTWTAAIARNIGGDINGDGLDDGTAAVIPEFQGRFAYKIFDKHTIGLSGHYAQRDTLGVDGKYDAWSANLDLSAKITQHLILNGSSYIGSNTASMLGGIGNASTMDGVASQGGWLNLKFNPKTNYSISTVIVLDYPCDCDLNDGARSKNTTIFANVYYDILQGFLIGFEFSYWATEYKNMDTETAIVGQIAFRYNF